MLLCRNAAISALQVHPLKRTQAQVGLILLLLRKNAVFTKLTAAFPPTLLHRLARYAARVTSFGVTSLTFL